MLAPRPRPFSALVLAVAIGAQEPAAPALPQGAPDAMAKIEQTGLREHATYLASDELGGRYTTSTGQVAAAEYVAAHFERLGLEPCGDGKGRKQSFFQAWPVTRSQVVADKTRIVVGQDTYRAGFAVVPGEKDKVKTSGFAWCGYGAPEDIPGGLRRVAPVVVLRTGGDLPRAGGVFVQQLNKARQICRELERKGAQVAVFCVLDDAGGFADQFNYQAMLPDKPVLRFGNERRGALQPMAVPAVFCNAAISRRLLAELGAREQGGEWQVDRKRAKCSGRLELEVELDADAEALNVVALLPGRSRAKEAVVVSAHMDHMGTRLDGDPFNGADDNASGTSAVLEIAEAFAAGEAPERSILFLVVSGEEEGLWGSSWFADHPTFPESGLVADVNIDMIGRIGDISGEHEISITPSKDHGKYSSLGRDAARLAEALGLSLTVGDKYYERSDHFNFARKGIPVVFFCDGEHADYHQVTDHADKLDYAKMERVARLAFWVAHGVANARERPREIGRQDQW